MPIPHQLIHFTRKDGTPDTALRIPIWTETGRVANAIRRKAARLKRRSPECRIAFLRRMRAFAREHDAPRAHRLASVDSFNQAVSLTRSGEFIRARFKLIDARRLRLLSNR